MMPAFPLAPDEIAAVDLAYAQAIQTAFAILVATYPHENPERRGSAESNFSLAIERARKAKAIALGQ